MEKGVSLPRIETAAPLESVLRLNSHEPVDPDAEIKVEWLETPVGPLLAGATESALVLLEFSERSILQQQLASIQRRFNTAIRQGRNIWIEALEQQLSEYFTQRRRQFELPLSYPGTAFQERVWSTLLSIPYGQ